MQTPIGFIGGGNMTRSLIGGLTDTGHPAGTLWVSEPEPGKRDYFEHKLGVNVTADNSELVTQCAVLVLAVKPQMIREVLAPLRETLQRHRPLLLSIAAGVTGDAIDRWSGGGLAVVRAMPNTPALVGSGATGLYANPRVTEAQRNAAESLMRAVGVVVWLEDESLLDPVTALSGSGPAYFLLFMESLEQAATARGIAPEVARLLVLETCLGTAKLAMESEEQLAELRRRVTSPGGTTERALAVLTDADLDGIVNRAFAAAAERATELGRILGEGDG